MLKHFNEKGFTAIAMVLLVMGIGLIVTTGLITIGTDSVKTSRSQSDDMRAHYIAEAGIKEAVARIEKESEWAGIEDKVYEGGNLKVEIKDQEIAGYNKQIIATGTYRNAKSSAESTTVVSSGFPSTNIPCQFQSNSIFFTSATKVFFALR